jgi:glycosyltransferase involved in cell wall biosynthesis
MIVKNESKIIKRCLNSCLGIIDYVCITDTGSTDSTVKIIQDWLTSNNIEGQVIISSFKDFGSARTESYVNSKKTYPQSNYFLLLDADMVLSSFGFDKNSLTDSCYYLDQITDFETYSNIRFISSKYSWECVGVTHECWVGTDHGLHLTTLKIRDLNDGASRSNKTKRDIELLIRGLATEKREYLITRYSFYLGLSYYHAQNYKLALEWFDIRIKKGGNDEEVFYCKLMKGKTYNRIFNNSGLENDLMLARHHYIEAWKKRPKRAEPLYYLSIMESGDFSCSQANHLAYFYCVQAYKIRFPTNESLFVDHPIYDWKIRHQLMVVSFFAQDHNTGRRVSLELIKQKDSLPCFILQDVKKNLKYYFSQDQINEFDLS